MAPRATSTRQQGRPLQTSRSRLDPVTPTATAALDARRHAQQMLREIDALLALNDTQSPVKAESSSSSYRAFFSSANDTPGPGAYDPQKERTQWRRHASVALHRPTPSFSKKTALIRAEHTRSENKTPGPGAYEITSADRVVKPRVRTLGFRLAEKSLDNSMRDAISRRPLELTTADKWLSRYKQPQGAVAYKASTPTVTSTTRDQRLRLRRILLDKTRHLRIGYYSVGFALTERRVGTVGIVPMDKSAMQCLRDSAKHVQAQTKRHVRLWRTADVASRHGGKKTTVSSDALPNSKRRATHTVQWKRARARALLQQRKAKKQVDTVESATGDVGCLAKSLRRDLRAHDMATHIGRDAVRCPRKNYDKMIGRDEIEVDANGVFLAGRDHAILAAAANDPSDHAVRPRVPIVIIREPPPLPTPLDQHTLVLSPKFTLTETRTRGHAFLAFENQLDRQERAKLKVFAVETEPQDLQYGETDEAREKLHFPRRDRGTVDFRRMVGRDAA